MSFDKEAAFRSIIGIGNKEDKIQEPVESPIKRGRPKSEKEIKKRISLAVYPSLYEKLTRIAFVQRKPASQIFEEMIEEFVEKHQDELQEYDRINK